MSKPFPKLIHVSVEGDEGSEYFVVVEDGVLGVDDPDEPIAIYQRVEVGRVNIVKNFVSTTRKKRPR